MRRSSFIHLWTFPFDLLTTISVLIIRILWGRRLHWLNGLWCELKPGSWPSKTWYAGWAGTCLGHGGFYSSGGAGGDGVDTPVEFHERVHSLQFEEACLSGFLAAIASSCFFQSRAGLIFGLVSWMISPFVAYAGSLLHSFLHNKKVYEESTMELSAYSLTEKWEREKSGLKEP